MTPAGDRGRSAQERGISEAKYRAHREIERTSKVYTRRLVPETPQARLLDVGCGTGVNAEHLREAGHRVTGVDLADTAVSAFVALGFRGAVCDASSGLPFRSSCFDTVFSSEVIEHLSDGEAFLRELHRVLRPGGHLVISTPNSAFWVYRVLAVLGRTLSDAQHPGHVRFYTVRSLRSLVERAGFSDVRIAARHIYLLLGSLPAWLEGPVGRLGFRRELRFKTGRFIWHLSRFSRRASPLWSDTLIVSALKPST